MSNRSKQSDREKWEGVEWLKSGEASELLGISKNTLRRLVQEGYLEAYRIKGVTGYQFKLSDVISLIEKVDPNQFEDED